MKYRKKPVVVDAVQWTGENQREMFDFLTDHKLMNDYMTASGKNFYVDHLVKAGTVKSSTFSLLLVFLTRQQMEKL